MAALITPARADVPRGLRIGYQKGGGLLGVLKARAILESTFVPRGVQVTWSEFPAGPQLLEALNAGGVDFGYTGAPPPIFAQAAGNDLLYVGAAPTGVSSEAIVVKHTSALTKAAELKGKSVAVQKGSSAHFLLLASLRAAGLQFSDIRPAFLAPAYARAAFEADRVDAWAIWDPYLASAQASSDLRSIADYRNLPTTFGFYLASRSFANQAPQQVSIVLDVLATTAAWTQANSQEAAKLLAQQVGLPVNVIEVWQRRAPYEVKPVDATVLTSQQFVADTFYEQRLIPLKVDVAAAVWHRPIRSP